MGTLKSRIFAAVCAALLWSHPAKGDSPVLRISREMTSSRELSLEVGQNRLLETSSALGRVSVANPDVADLKVITNTQLLLTAKSVGDTYLTVWDKADVPLVLSLHVSRNLDALQKQLKELFPTEDITASSAGDLVVLSGEVSDIRIPERALAVGRLHAQKIANQIKVRGNHQVQLEVKFSEVSRTGLREMGFSFFHNNGDRVGGMTGPSQPLGGFANAAPNRVPGADVPGVPAVYPGMRADAFSLFFSGLSQFPFSAVLSLLEQNSLAKTLAEPTLVSMTGQEARFLAGGEFPIPLATGFGTVQVTYKKFGIQLVFTPTVLSDGLINLKLATEVSEIDPSVGVQIGGFTVPGLSSRQSDTTVRMRDGQSFAIAGLLSDRSRNSMAKVPWLGDLPVLGTLFRSSQFRRDETELLVVITARLVQPLGARMAPVLPGGTEVNDPDDFSLFVLGRTSQSPSHPPSRGEAISVPGHHLGGPAGQVGYIR
ncbi:type II and III secretion system protein family protein [Pendulispora brunnea]|uniref:Type II and III secretion system protein family protein n=1 Tax=Pendulispora brunnea TaxID=2905690 RepID=A0ABZ2JXZ3_9BACT